MLEAPSRPIVRKCLGWAVAAASFSLASERAEAALSCSVSTVAVAFGAYNPRNSTATDGVGSITVSCSGGTPGAMSASSSTGQSGTYSARTMKAGSFVLNYNLYTNSTHTTVWGNGSTGTSVRSITGVGTYTVWGRIPALQNVGAGSYSDTISVTLTF